MKAFYIKLKKYKNSKLFKKTRFIANAILVLEKENHLINMGRGKFVCVKKRLQ